jgi:hypothetical protein
MFASRDGEVMESSPLSSRTVEADVDRPTKRIDHRVNLDAVAVVPVGRDVGEPAF